jgi:hypothetical protein
MEIPFCLFVAACSGATLLYFYYHNKNRRIERYLLKNDRKLFLLLQFAYFILVISLVFNARYVVYQFAELVKVKYT